MAQAYTVIGNRFRPFTYDELIKPVMAAEQAHRELEDTYADLSAKAGIWENLANEQTDPKAYSMYKNYAENLNSLAGQLAKEGLSPTSRQDAIRMKQRYSTDIIPIEQAYSRRRQLADEQRQMRAKDPTIMYQRDANVMSLDDFLANPEADYGKSYSGALLTKQVADAATNLRRQMRENPRIWKRILGDQYYETRMQSGFTADEINQAIYDPEHADPVLVNLMNSVLESSGVLDWLDPSMVPQARGYAGQGLWNAIGEVNYQTLQNQGYLNPAQRAALASEEINYPINPVNFISWRERSEEEKEWLKNVKKYSDYFVMNKSGKYELTEKGKKKYDEFYKGYTDSERRYNPDMNNTILSPFRQFMDSITDENEDIGEAWRKYIEDDPRSRTAIYDATADTGYNYAFDSTMQDIVRNGMLEGVGTADVDIVDWDGKTKSFVKTGESYKSQEIKNALNNGKAKVLSMTASPYGNIMTIAVEDKNGNTTVSYISLIANNPDQVTNLENSMKKVEYYRQLINTGEITLEDGSVRKLSDRERAYIKRHHDDELKNSYDIMASIFPSNKTEDVKYPGKWR